MNRVLKVWIGAAMTLRAAAGYASGEVFPVAHGGTIAVRVLGGKDGKPQVHAHVILVGGYDQRDLGLGLWREEVLTDGEGTVRLSNALGNLPLLRVEVEKRRACETDANRAAISVERIRRDGLSGANRCGMVVANNAPGVFTIFVKAPRAGATGEAKNAYSVPLVAPMKP
jgi:hypothetical protein